jgi:hypothetical protein
MVELRYEVQAAVALWSSDGAAQQGRSEHPGGPCCNSAPTTHTSGRGSADRAPPDSPRILEATCLRGNTSIPSADIPPYCTPLATTLLGRHSRWT